MSQMSVKNYETPVLRKTFSGLDITSWTLSIAILQPNGSFQNCSRLLTLICCIKGTVPVQRVPDILSNFSKFTFSVSHFTVLTKQLGQTVFLKTTRTVQGFSLRMDRVLFLCGVLVPGEGAGEVDGAPLSHKHLARALDPAYSLYIRNNIRDIGSEYYVTKQNLMLKSWLLNKMVSR